MAPFMLHTYSEVMARALIVEREMEEAQRLRNRNSRFGVSEKGERGSKCQSNALVEGMILCFSTWTHVLFDYEASHSFIFASFASMLNLEFVPLHSSLYVETLVGGKMEAKWVYDACVLYIEGYEVTIDLVLLDMSAFDVIVGMDWLAQHHAVLDCYLKKVTFQISSGSYTNFYGDQGLVLFDQ